MRCYACDSKDAKVFDSKTGRDYCVECTESFNSLVPTSTLFENPLPTKEEEDD